MGWEVLTISVDEFEEEYLNSPINLANSSSSRTSILFSFGKDDFRRERRRGSGVPVRCGPKYRSSSESGISIGEVGSVGSTGEDEMIMIDLSRGRNRDFMAGGVCCAARIAWVDGGQSLDNDIDKNTNERD